MKKDFKEWNKVFHKQPTNPFIRGRYFLIKKKLRTLGKHLKNQFKQGILQQLDVMQNTNPKEFWKLLEKLNISNRVDIDPTDAVDSQNWETHFSKLLNENRSTLFDTQHQKVVENMISDYDSQPHTTNLNLDYPVTEDEIKICVKKLKTGKSSGTDSISNEMLKAASPYIMPYLLKLFNDILDSGNFPKSWSHCLITPIHKNGNIDDPNNYRGIAVTSCLGKLFISVLTNRIELLCERNDVIDDIQGGFRKNCRTSDNMFILNSLIHKFKSEKRTLYACFVDFAKAFDSVWHLGLWYKLIRMGITGNVLSCIRSMYQNSSAQVKLRLGLSDNFHTSKGVLQGNNLSPLLFNLFVNDLHKSVFTSDDSVSINSKKLSCLLYADDLVLLASDPVSLQNNLNRLNTYCNKWHLSVNLKKTKIVAFSTSGRKCKHQFVYDKKLIDNVSEYNYLGIKFASSGTFTFAKKELIFKARKALFKVYKSVNYPLCSVQLMSKLFDTLVKPILLYGSEIWGDSNNILVETMHNKYCKSLLGVNKNAPNSAVLGDLGRYPMQIYIDITVIKYWLRVANKDCRSLVWDAYQSELHQKEHSKWLTHVKNLLSQHGFLNVWQNPSAFNSENFWTVFLKELLIIICLSGRLKLKLTKNLNYTNLSKQSLQQRIIFTY